MAGLALCGGESDNIYYDGNEVHLLGKGEVAPQ